MAGVLASLTEEQQQVCRLLPFPIASAWHQILLATSRSQLDQRLIAQVEVIARTLGTLVLCDYLRGPVDEPVEVLVAELDKPTPEDWVALVGAGLDSLARRQDPPPMLDAALEWRSRRAHADRVGLEQLAWCVELRRSMLTSTGVDTGFDAATQTDQMMQATLDLVESLRWLGAWRLARVVSMTTLRHRGFVGKVQLFQGADESPEPIDAAWSAHLVSDAVYLLDPSATQALEVSPLIRVLPHPRHRRPLCFLFHNAPGLDRLVLAEDATGVRVETSIAGPEGEMPFADWLARRQEHGAWLHNEDLGGSLAVDGAQPVYHAPRHAPPVRPISDLSQFAFRRQSSHWQSLGDWRSRAILAAQLGVVVAIGAVCMFVLAPRFQKVSAQIDDEAARPKMELVPVEPVHRPRPLLADPPPAQGQLAAAAAAQAAVEAALAAQQATAADARGGAVARPASGQDAQASPPPAQVAAAQAEPKPPAEVAKAAPVAAAPERAVLAAEPPPAARTAPQPAAAPAREPAALAVQARKDAALRPTYAILKLLAAKRHGSAQADACLAEILAEVGPKARCRHHALLAVARDPSDSRSSELAVRCGGQPAQAKAEPDPPIDPKELARDLYAEAYAVIYGVRHSPAERRKMAKDLYQLSAELGYAKAHTGLAAIYLYGETNKVKCRAEAEVAVQLGDTGPAKKLIELCK